MNKRELINDLIKMQNKCGCYIKAARINRDFSKKLADKNYYEFIANYWEEKFNNYGKYCELLEKYDDWVKFIQRTSLDMCEFIYRVDAILDSQDKKVW